MNSRHICATAAPSVTVSVVSHGHGAMVAQLLGKLDALCTQHVGRVVLTLNTPEPALSAAVAARSWAFELTVLHNLRPKGFGANHNSAFEHNTLDFFCVLNPDVDFDTSPFADLLAKLASAHAGCSFPVQVGANGCPQDFARQVPSPAALLNRYKPLALATVGWTRNAPRTRALALPLTAPDWVNGACLLFRSKVFEHLAGFDARYFMYCEDVDICLRLQLAGYGLVPANAVVTHAAQRSSRVNWRHTAWHVASLLRLWVSAPYRDFLRRPPKAND